MNRKVAAVVVGLLLLVGALLLLRRQGSAPTAPASSPGTAPTASSSPTPAGSVPPEHGAAAGGAESRDEAEPVRAGKEGRPRLAVVPPAARATAPAPPGTAAPKAAGKSAPAAPASAKPAGKAAPAAGTSAAKPVGKKAPARAGAAATATAAAAKPSSAAASSAGGKPAAEAAGAPIPAPAPAARRVPGLPGALSGFVRDAQGRPIPGATVLAVASDGGDASETFTDDEGFFLQPALRPGRYAVFAGLATALSGRIGGRGVEVAPLVVSRLDLLEPASGAIVRVRAIGENGTVMPAQAVLVTPSGAPVLGGDAIWMPGGGAALDVVPRVPPGVYTVILLRNGSTPPRASREPVSVTGDLSEVQVDVPLATAVAAADLPQP